MSCKVTLRDVSEFQKGFAFKSKDYREDGVKIVKVSNLTNNSVDISQCVCVDESTAEIYKSKYNLVNNDIVITTVGSWPTNPASVVGKVIRVPKEANDTLLNQNAVRLRGNSLIKQSYMYYLLKDKTFKEYIIGTAQGSANQASITQEDIKNFEFDLPSLEEQEKIANILSSLDDKIELNNEMNKTLEEMASSLFKRWFVDFEFPNEDGEPYKSSGEMVDSELGMIPKGWEVQPLKNLINLTMGLSPKSSTYNTYGEGIPLLNGAADFDTTTISPTKYTTDPKRVCNMNDIIFCIRGTIGNVTFADDEYCLGRGVAALSPINDIDRGIIFLNLNRMIDKLKANASGSVIVGISKSDIEDAKVIVSPKEIRESFNNKFKTIYNKIQNCNIDNINLIEIRDVLLPKLMSGEITIQK